MAGDCQNVVCDGSGATKLVANDGDVPTSTDPCVVLGCSTGKPTQNPAAATVTCSQNGGTVCGDPTGAAAGKCVACNTTTDCTATPGTSCATNKCVPVGCSNGVKDGSETAVDCGGPTCATCDVGLACLVNTDCTSVYCNAKVCVKATCTDGVKDGNESDADCGGSCTKKCDDGLGCGTSGDCLNGDCAGGVCISCMDKKKNGGETDVDCGGSICTTKCADGLACVNSGDCIDGPCSGGICLTCPDGRKDGTETDVDCGGSCSTKCGTEQGCLSQSDCASGVCSASNKCVVQFGGPCSAGADCISTFCNAQMKCDALTLATLPAPGAIALAVNASNIYYGSGTSVVQLPLSGAPSVKLPIGIPQLMTGDNTPGLFGVGGIVADPTSTWVYWTEGFQITNSTLPTRDTVVLYRTTVADGSTVELGQTLAQGGKKTTAIGINATTVFIGDTGGSTGQICSAPIGSSPLACLGLGAISAPPNNMAANASTLFWTGGGALHSGLLPSFTVGTTTLAASGVAGIALDINNIYWAVDNSPGGIMKAPVGGGAATTLVPSQASAYGVAVDANYVYWTLSTATGSVMKAPLSGSGPVVTLASGQATPTNLVVDSTYVYWSNAGDYTIRKIPK